LAGVIVLDASVVIAFLNGGDAHHERAVGLFTDNAADGFGMHNLTLAEVLVGGVRVGRANQLLSDLRSVGIAALDPVPQEAMILAELRATSGLKMPDCCVLAVALHESAPVATFDEQLARSATALGLHTVFQ
jgi:predicted nucleic acid-binding protein